LRKVVLRKWSYNKEESIAVLKLYIEKLDNPSVVPKSIFKEAFNNLKSSLIGDVLHDYGAKAAARGTSRRLRRA
jgi:hypothetical protein